MGLFLVNILGLLSSVRIAFIACYWKVFLLQSESKSKSKSHCNWRSVSVSVLVSSPIWGHDQIFITIWQLRSCFCGAPSLRRRRVSLLYMLLALASVVFLRPESLGTLDHILLSQIWEFPFRRLLRRAGSRWKYSNPPPHGCSSCSKTCIIIMNSVPTSQETHCVFATKPNRLMLFREIIVVYCKNHTEHTNTLCGQNAEFSSYLTGNTLRLRYKAHRLMLFREIIAWEPW
jgi:hypothetical protein